MIRFSLKTLRVAVFYQFSVLFFVKWESYVHVLQTKMSHICLCLRSNPLLSTYYYSNYAPHLPREESFVNKDMQP